MKLTDRYSDGMTLQAIDAGDGLHLDVQYDNSPHGVTASLGVTLDESAQEQLLRAWLSIRFKQQGHGALARALQNSPADLQLMEKVLSFAAVEVSR